MTQLFRNRDTLTAARLGLASVPTWARTPDTTGDATEHWQNACDPENERGEKVDSYFDYVNIPSADEFYWVRVCQLKGVRVWRGAGDNIWHEYLTRTELVARFGLDWVDAVDTEQTRLEAGE